MYQSQGDFFLQKQAKIYQLKAPFKEKPPRTASPDARLHCPGKPIPPSPPLQTSTTLHAEGCRGTMGCEQPPGWMATPQCGCRRVAVIRCHLVLCHPAGPQEQLCRPSKCLSAWLHPGQRAHASQEPTTIPHRAQLEATRTSLPFVMDRSRQRTA